jgi:hypothetical protein
LHTFLVTIATAAILEKLNIAGAPTHCGHGFCNFLLQNIHPSPRNIKLKMFAYFFFENRYKLHSSQYLSTLGLMTAPGIHTSEAWKDRFINKKIHTCNKKSVS